MGKKRVEYRCVTTSVEGFVQQVAVQYVRHGYWFYVAGQIPEDKDPAAVDTKLIKKYGIDVSRWERARRKRSGLANMQYIRHERFFLLMATHGRHRFFDDEAAQIRDARRVSIKFAGYSLSHRNGHTSVRIEVNTCTRLKARLVDIAPRRSAEHMEAEFVLIQFEPYTPVRQQLLGIWRAVNRVRHQGGLRGIPVGCIRWKRLIVKPFGGAAGAARSTVHSAGVRLADSGPARLVRVVPDAPEEGDSMDNSLRSGEFSSL